MTKPLLVWCHSRMDFDNLALCHNHWAPTLRLDDAHIAFINHETDQYPLTNNPDIKWIASNTTNSILTVGDEIPGEEWDYLWLGDSSQLETITATAEHTLGLILAVHRNIPRAMRHVEAGKWNRYELGVPKMLSRSIITIIGHGRIGGMLASYCKPLFETVCIIDKTHDWRANLHTLLPKTDVLAICASKQMLDEFIVGYTEIRLLPKGAIIVNTSCHDNLNTTAAFEALEYGNLWGVGLDVLSKEHIKSIQIPAPHAEENLIITPHIGGSTEDAWHDTQKWVIEGVINNL